MKIRNRTSEGKFSKERLEDRFFEKVAIASIDECWEWTGSKVNNTYGHIKVSGKMVMAHRVSYEIAYGVIPSGLQIDHICHNKSCVNPSHLRLATMAQNARNKPLRLDNKTGFKGVSFVQRLNKWKAQIRVNRRDLYLGLFETIEAAHAAYCSAALIWHGEFANTGDNRESS